MEAKIHPMIEDLKSLREKKIRVTVNEGAKTVKIKCTLKNIDFGQKTLTALSEKGKLIYFKYYLYIEEL